LKHRGNDIDPNKVYSLEEIIEFFNKDKENIEKEVAKVFDDRFMTQNMYDALFSFTYDVGKLEKTELGKMIKKNPFDERIYDFWQYTYTCNYKNEVAVKRRKLEVELYFKD
jgi:GH24 family phage-related lysozyme (muramidase)